MLNSYKTIENCSEIHLYTLFHGSTSNVPMKTSRLCTTPVIITSIEYCTAAFVHRRGHHLCVVKFAVDLS